MKTLNIPCPHCGNLSLQPPVKNKNRWYSLCGSCDRKSLYVIHDKVNGLQSYSIVKVGAPNRGMKRGTFFLRISQLEALQALPMRQQSETVRRALAGFGIT